MTNSRCVCNQSDTYTATPPEEGRPGPSRSISCTSAGRSRTRYSDLYAKLCEPCLSQINYIMTITTMPSPRLGMYTSHNVPKQHLLLIPCFLEARQFVFNGGLSLFHKQLFSLPKVLMFLDLQALKPAHAAIFLCSCCRRVRSSSRPMEVPASLDLALNLSTQCACLCSPQSAQAHYPAQHPSSPATAWRSHIEQTSLFSQTAKRLLP